MFLNSNSGNILELLSRPNMGSVTDHSNCLHTMLANQNRIPTNDGPVDSLMPIKSIDVEGKSHSNPQQIQQPQKEKEQNLNPYQQFILNRSQIYKEIGEELNPSVINNFQGPPTDKQIVCWNCLSILTVKSDWGIVQCPHCDKFNRVPSDDQSENEKTMLNPDKRNFDVVAPYVYAVMTCPYCQTENKVRKEAEHICCYNCYNSFSIENPTIKTVSDKKPISIPGKVQRYSDMFFPDPMYYPGKFPVQQPLVNNMMLQQGLRELNDLNKMNVIDQVVAETSKKPKKEKNIVLFRPGDPIKQLIRDVDEINGKRNLSFAGKTGNDVMVKIYDGISNPNDFTFMNGKKDSDIKNNRGVSATFAKGILDNNYNNNYNSNLNINNNNMNINNNNGLLNRYNNFNEGYNNPIQRYKTPDIINKASPSTFFNGTKNFINKMMFSNWNNTYKL